MMSPMQIALVLAEVDYCRCHDRNPTKAELMAWCKERGKQKRNFWSQAMEARRG